MVLSLPRMCEVEQGSGLKFATPRSIYYVEEEGKNKTLMVRVSWAMMPLLLAGILSEGVPSCIWSQYAKDHPPQNNILCFFHQSFHEMVYLMHGGIAVVAILETKQLLPPDSWRATFALVSFFASLMWEDHATMKHNPTEAAMHHFVAVTCLLQAACLTCSVLRPDHIPVYVACWACSILRGLWFWTARLCYAPFMTQQISGTALSGMIRLLLLTSIEFRPPFFACFPFPPFFATLSTSPLHLPPPSPLLLHPCMPFSPGVPPWGVLPPCFRFPYSLPCISLHLL
jgi:hypothetical protein